MEYIEITGKTVDEAITNATIKLSVTSDKLDYVVVDKGNNGFLGIGKRPAVIKVRVAENVDEFPGTDYMNELARVLSDMGYEKTIVV